MQKTLGGERLNSGKKMKVFMSEFERSTHDLSSVWKSTMSAGTIVPFMKLIGLPGDTFDIGLNCDVLTLPTIGPMFDTYTINLDVFESPFSLYQSGLQQNLIGIGMKMQTVVLPQVRLLARVPEFTTEQLDNEQVNSSCIFRYLGIAGLGHSEDLDGVISRDFAAPAWLSYWDIYATYYSNKQEGYGAVIHKEPYTLANSEINVSRFDKPFGFPSITIPQTPVPADPATIVVMPDTLMSIAIDNPPAGGNIDGDDIMIMMENNNGFPFEVPGTRIMRNWNWNPNTGYLTGSSPNYGADWPGINENTLAVFTINLNTEDNKFSSKPDITMFTLSEINAMRIKLLAQPYNTPYVIDTNETTAPYNLALRYVNTEEEPPLKPLMSIQYSQEGLALKCYKSDLFNNWLDTEWVTGPNGINEITAISAAGGQVMVDEINLKSKVYTMLYRIGISGGTYDDYLDAVWGHQRRKGVTNPIYHGGLIQNLVFQEVIASAETPGQPLGTLAGRGRIGQFRKGGKIIIKIDEPGIIMGMVTITPNIGYSQGNDWDVNLKNMDQFHKPSLDEIGFQDLITDQMAWFDTKVIGANDLEFKSAGKQPAWINYMTAVNKNYGHFAEQNNSMFMTLNRRYESAWGEDNLPYIGDLTTYIDPSKFNHIFANTAIDAQNFWVQIAMDITVRRKMSAKIIPNL